jgi:undecaprenyl-diphosphatase
MIEYLISLDVSLFQFMNSGLSNTLFDILMQKITHQNNWIIPLCILFYILLFKTGKRGKIAFIILLIGFGITDYFSAQYIKPFIGRIRPSHSMLDSIHLLVNKGGKWSFPSNHAANSFVLATILSYFFSQWKYPLFILASLIGFSRIYVGVHYPGDVVFGALLGYCIAWILLSIWVILKMRELKRGRTWVWYTSDTINK